MKKFGTIAIIVTILIASYFGLLFTSISFGVSHNTGTITTPSNDSSFGNLFFSSNIPDSLPYAKYKIIADIHNAFIQKKEQINNSPGLSGWGFFNMGLRSGIAETNNYDNLPANFSTENLIERLALKDSLNNLITEEKNKEKISNLKKQVDSIDEHLHFNPFDLALEQRSKNDNYFSIGKYNLKDYETKFFIKNGTYNLAKVKWQQNKNNPNNKIGKYYIEKINFRYSSTNKEILKPISATTFKFLEILLIIFLVIASIAIIYFYVGIPIQILVNISRGDAFSIININYLNAITKFTVALTLFSFIVPRLLKFILIKEFYSDFTVSNPDGIVDFLKFIFFIVALILIRKAFIKGKNLQQENELTV